MDDQIVHSISKYFTIPILFDKISNTTLPPPQLLQLLMYFRIYTKIKTDSNVTRFISIYVTFIIYRIFTDIKYDLKENMTIHNNHTTYRFVLLPLKFRLPLHVLVRFQLCTLISPLLGPDCRSLPSLSLHIF